jgi:hypothetical protein
MNARFDLTAGHAVGEGAVLDIHRCSIPIGAEFDAGDYVVMHVITGDAGEEGKPETNKQLSTPVMMRKGEARAVASCLMGVAAEIGGR